MKDPHTRSPSSFSVPPRCPTSFAQRSTSGWNKRGFFQYGEYQNMKHSLFQVFGNADHILHGSSEGLGCQGKDTTGAEGIRQATDAHFECVNPRPRSSDFNRRLRFLSCSFANQTQPVHRSLVQGVRQQPGVDATRVTSEFPLT